MQLTAARWASLRLGEWRAKRTPDEGEKINAAM
jgi:hypothetical protein